MFDFSNRNVLVVGGSSGIGNGVARAFHDAGGNVCVWGTRPNAGDYAAEPGCDLTEVSYSQVDVTDAAAVRDAALPFDGLDILVLSQGTVLYRRAEFEIEGFRRVVEVNLNSLMSCAGRFHDELAAARGSLIIISSAAAFHATKGTPAYNASKTGAFGLTRTLAQAWAGDGIRVNGIAPGLVDTKLTKVTVENTARMEAALASIPRGRIGTVEDVGGAALFLASPLADYIIGQTILVDGGYCL